VNIIVSTGLHLNMKKILEEVGPEYFRTFMAVRNRLAPDVPPQDYFNAQNEYIRRMNGRVRVRGFGTRIITPEEAVRISDNSADYEDIKYRYRGVDKVRSIMAEGQPLVFVVWHNGAQHHGDYGIARIFPQIALFTHFTHQYGKVFSYPMNGRRQAFSLVKMDRFLRDGRPVLYYLDGPPLGKTIELSLLGVPSRISTAPIELFRSVDGLQIIPVTRYYSGEDEVQFTFHYSRDIDQLLSRTTREVLNFLLGCLERDQLENAPEQVMWRRLCYRRSKWP